MSMKFQTSIFIIFSLLVVACGDQSYVEKKPQAGKLSEDNAFKDYESAIDKAKGVEQTIMDAAEQRQEEMEERGY